MSNKCYICLPIQGHESTVLERTEAASKAVKSMGYDPVTPIDINSINDETLANHSRPVGKFMGKDIETLIDECTAIYVCKGWENSKGCNVEVECAKQYNKHIIYEEIPLSEEFKSVVIETYKNALRELDNYIDKYGDDSLAVSIFENSISQYEHFFKTWFKFDVMLES